jgi:MerR family transcriptional regulator, light-induced transcriptional regulator
MPSPTERSFTPRQIAEGLGVSESSVKRWIDAGHLEAGRTVGGHRRVALHEIVRYLRESGAEVVRPDALGLTGPIDPGDEELPSAEQLSELFTADKTQEAHDLIVSAYLRGNSLAALCDGPIREALHKVGSLWDVDCAEATQTGIVTEHRATDVVIQALGHIRSLIPSPPNGFGAAVGGALTGDTYIIPSAMVAAVMADQGTPAVNLGPHTPPEALLSAAKRFRASVLWVSCSFAPDIQVMNDQLRIVADGARQLGSQLFVGGRLTSQLTFTHNSMRKFESLGALVRVLASRR